MKERLQTILNLENLPAAQLSALLDIQRSTLSNLMSGRNNPSYDFIVAIMTKLPNLNVEWLLKGIGQPYKNPEKNFRGMSLNDAINTDKDHTSILCQSNTNTISVSLRRTPLLPIPNCLPGSMISPQRTKIPRITRFRLWSRANWPSGLN